MGYQVSTSENVRLNIKLIGYMLSSEGRGAAAEVDAWLMGGSTRLPNAGGIKTRVSLYDRLLSLFTKPASSGLCHQRVSIRMVLTSFMLGLNWSNRVLGLVIFKLNVSL